MQSDQANQSSNLLWAIDFCWKSLHENTCHGFGGGFNEG